MLLGAYGLPRPGGLAGQCLHSHGSAFRGPPPSRLRVSAGLIGPGKKWEHYETNQNGLPIRHKLHVKQGDLVKVIAGGDKGKVGKVTEVNLKLRKIVVEGVNVRAKLNKRRAPGDENKGYQDSESPVDASNVMLYSEQQKVASRVGHRVLEDGRRVRYLKKTGEVID